MKQLNIDDDVHRMIVTALEQVDFFQGLKPTQLDWVADQADAYRFTADDTLMEHSESPDSFMLLMRGTVSVQVPHSDDDPERDGEMVEVARLEAVDTIGEIGLLLSRPRTATVVALDEVTALRFSPKAFRAMYRHIPDFGFSVSRELAARLSRTSQQLPVPEAIEYSFADPDEDAIRLLPRSFMARHRIVPLHNEGNEIDVGFVDDPSTRVISSLRNRLPGMRINPKRIDLNRFNDVLGSHAGLDDATGPPPAPSPSAADAETGETSDTSDLIPSTGGDIGDELAVRSPKLHRLLLRMVSEGASDLHLSAKQRPYWRIDGQIRRLEDAAKFGPEEVFRLLEPAMSKVQRSSFRDDRDIDFGITVEGLARFRVNLFVDHHGAGAVFRQIPNEILSLDQLGMPAVCRKLADKAKGLVLVTGPTGAGKSTTLAAMIDYINENRREHIITIEDPIEFLHDSKLSLVNQREVGVHTDSFAAALRAGLREDPDVVLVGELRDLETIRIALETANTGHLVFGTLHTSTAPSTIDRIIGQFPSEEEDQVRSTLADSLQGVISQVLCRRKGGGRIAAYEAMVNDHAISNLIRENKLHQIKNTMQTTRDQGSALLNDTLSRFVRHGYVTYPEALRKTVDQEDLAKRLGKKAPSQF